MNKVKSIKMTKEFVRNKLEHYDSGHDWWHIERVRNTSLYINTQEVLADPFILEITALLHDSADSKFYDGENEKGITEISEFMMKAGMSDIRDRVTGVIRNISFSNKNPAGDISDPLLHVVQDADRLDAMGAIGIARAFTYGGFRNNKIYIPDSEPGVKSTIQHFYDKLLVLKERMNTSTAKRLAVERHAFLEIFLNRFYEEWEFAIP